MRQAARLSPEAEHTVWWLLLCRAVERAARAAEREACAKVCDEHYDFLVATAQGHEEGSASRDRLFSAARAVDRVRQELRARAEGDGEGGA